MPSLASRLTFLFASSLIVAGAAGCPGEPGGGEPGPDGPELDGREPDAPPPPPSWRAITAADGGVPLFGGSLAVSGDTMIVGTSRGATEPGAAYIYVRRDGQWVQQARLAGDESTRTFGVRVAVSGDVALVSATAGAGERPVVAQVHVFERDGESWERSLVLDAAAVASEGALSGGIAIDGDTFAIGDAGHTVDNQLIGQAVHLFVREGGGWTLEDTVTPPAAQPGYSFADALALSGRTLIVGDRAGWAAEHDAATGLAHVFTAVDSPIGRAWELQATLSPTFNNVWPQPIGFGAEVAVRGDRAVIAVPRGTPCSYALVFERSGASWAQARRIDSGHNVCGDVGWLSLALGDDILALGAGGSGGDFPSSGAAYVHVRTGADWVATPPAPLPVLAPSAGEAVALTADSVLIGSPASRTVYEYPLAP